VAVGEAGASGHRPRAPEPDGDATALAKNSLAVVAWSAVSRMSGFVRIAVIAAVLGPTYLGNIFQATNNLPMIAYAALTGSLFSNLLIPPLVRHIDSGDRQAAARLAGGFLSAALAAFGVVCLVIILASPLVLRLLSLGVTDPAAAASQQRAGLILLVIFIPQMMFYAVVGTAEAVMNAHGRFALASAAPTLENAGIIATMLATALIYGTGDALSSPTTPQLLLLGLGTTSAVALHAGVQWWGARRVGVTLLPRRAWRDPELRTILRRAVPSLGYSSLDVVQPLGAMVVANRVPGGVIAFQLAWNFYVLPAALGARPVAVALLPRLSRLFHADEMRRFRDELVRGISLVAFLIVPAAVAYLTLSEPIARAVTFGQMATAQGQSLIALSLAALGPGVLGYAALLLGTHACYARQDVRTPFSAAVLRAGVAAVGMTLAFLVPAGGIALLALGLTISTADLVGGSRLVLRLRRVLPMGGGVRLGRPLLHTLGASVLMAVPAYLIAHRLPDLVSGRSSAQVAVVTAAVAGAVVFVLVQWWWRSPELALLGHGLSWRRAVRAAPRGDPDMSASGRSAHRTMP
jgi:putative peptidoglycan lipid II flippase